MAEANTLEQALQALVSQTRLAMTVDCCSVYVASRTCAAIDWLRPMVWPNRPWARPPCPFEQGIVGLVGQREELINLADAPLTPVLSSCPMWRKRRFAPSSALPSCISVR